MPSSEAVRRREGCGQVKLIVALREAHVGIDGAPVQHVILADVPGSYPEYLDLDAMLEMAHKSLAWVVAGRKCAPECMSVATTMYITNYG